MWITRERWSVACRVGMLDDHMSVSPFIAYERQAVLQRYWSQARPQQVLESYLDNELTRQGESYGVRGSHALAFSSLGALGETYFWSEAVTSIVRSAMNVPASWSWEPWMWPSSDGFFYFERPVSYECSEYPIGAISWVMVVYPDGKGEPPFIMAPPSKAPIDTNDAMALTFWAVVEGVPVLSPLTNILVPVGATIGGGEHEKDLGNPEAALFKMQLLAAMLEFLQQRILVTTRHSQTRAERRRISQESDDPNIRVVLLRRAAPSHTENDEVGPINWNYRWFVRGHWRDQWYPSDGRHRPRWITTYIKGPEDKPVKESDRIFAVVR